MPGNHRHRNNFDALRLVAATAVIVGHAFPLTGTRGSLAIFGLPISSFGVTVFFAVSGYLITLSWLRSGGWVPYLYNRCLRIFPGLIVVVLLSIFVLGVLVTTLSAASYFQSPETWRYLFNIVLRPIYSLPGVFDANPYARSVNGSLWTLPIEFACYLVIPLALLVTRFRKLSVVILGCACAAFYLLGSSANIAWGTSWHRASDLAVYFAVGALLALTRHKIRYPLILIVGVFLMQLGLSCWGPPTVSSAILWMTVPYMTIGLGIRTTPLARSAARYGDFSYGMYIYAFPLQQLVVMLLPGLSLWPNILLVTALSIVAGFCSWHLVEKRFLTLKRRPAILSATPPAPAKLGS